jgi:hypothetical protein
MKKLLHTSNSKVCMKQLLSDVLFALAIIAFGYGIYYHYKLIKEGPIKYDCRKLIAGWHPDVPVKVMEECRKKGFKKENAN